MSKQSSTYFAPICFFCGKNNKRRHSRRGHTWTCDHCHEVNPGPSMVKKLVGKLTEAPSADGMRTGRAPAKVAVTKIKTTAITPAAATPAKTNGATKPSPKPEPAPVTKPAAAVKKRGLFDGLKEAVYG